MASTDNFIATQFHQMFSGDIVTIDGYDGIKWISQHDWYIYNNQRQLGWYFISIPDGVILPFSEVSLDKVHVITVDRIRHFDYGREEPDPFVVFDQTMRSAFVTVDTLAGRDAIADLYPIPHGKMVKVNEVSKIYSYDEPTATWVECLLVVPVNSET